MPKFWHPCAALIGLGFGLSACNGCSGDKPYTPFGVASTLPPTAVEPPPSVTSEASAAPASTAPAGFARRPAELLPGAPRTAQNGDQTLTAPDARAFAQMVRADFDGDQKPDALAWLTPAPGAKDAPPGELWYFGGSKPPQKLLALPSFVPSGPDCTVGISLAQTGPHSASLDAEAVCKTALISRTPQRALVVVSPADPHPVLLSLRIAAPAPDETLTLAVDSSDQDQDGRDDVRVSASVARVGSGDAASADLAWVQRPAGISRLASEPAASLIRLGARLNTHAHNKHGGPSEGERVNNVLRLLSTLCAEGGVPRVFDEEGSALRCGGLSQVIDQLWASSVEGALAQGDVLEAFAAFARDGWYFGKGSSGERKALERGLLRSVTKFDVSTVLGAQARPSLPRPPRFSPLWFEADGSLLIRGDAQVTRVSADRTSEQALSPEAGAPSWPLEILGQNGARLVGTSHACDRSELLFNQNDSANHALPALMTRLLAGRPASCAGRGTGPVVNIAPISFEHGRLDALVAGSRILAVVPGTATEPALPALGTPLSPDGHTVVSTTPLGLLIAGDRKELWQLGNLHEHADVTKLSDCVVGNAASAVACIEAGHVVIFARAEPSTHVAK